MREVSPFMYRLMRIALLFVFCLMAVRTIDAMRPNEPAGRAETKPVVLSLGAFGEADDGNPATDSSPSAQSAAGSDTWHSVILPLLEAGYRSAAEAARECESQYLKRIRLPVYTPPVGHSYEIARCAATEGDGHYLELDYLHDEEPHLRYMIIISPAKHKIVLPKDKGARTLRLDDGSTATFRVTPGTGYSVLDMERDGWQYIFVRMQPDAGGDVAGQLMKAANSVPSFRAY